MTSHILWKIKAMFQTTNQLSSTLPPTLQAERWNISPIAWAEADPGAAQRRVPHAGDTAPSRHPPWENHGKTWEKQLTTGIWPCDKLQETMTVVPCWETIKNNAGKWSFNFAHRFLNKYTWYSVDNWVEKLHETTGNPSKCRGVLKVVPGGVL